VAGRTITKADAWARLGDVGRCALVAGALLLPLRRRDFDGSFNALTAVLASSAVCKAIKPFVPERRPNGEDSDSFPSQHAAECFAAGLALRRYFGRDAGAAAIAGATLVAMSRLFAKKHFLIDVLAGVVIGTAATIAVEAYEGARS
jgi:membrane-associated phospholipid phosphatase